MTGHRIVPLQPPEAISRGFFSCNAKRGDAGMEEFHYWHGDFGNFVASWQKAVNAAPRYEITDADAERAARAMFDCWRGYNEETQRNMWLMEKPTLLRKARAALEAFRDGLEGK